MGSLKRQLISIQNSGNIAGIYSSDIVNLNLGDSSFKC